MTNFINIDERLKDFTVKQIEELKNKYYDGVKIEKLIKEYNLDISTKSFINLLPLEVCEDKICPYCNVALMGKRAARTDFRKWKVIYCPKCNHKVDTSYCNCLNCEKKRDDERKELRRKDRLRIIKKRKLIKEIYSLNRYNPISFETLNFIEKVYLGALLKAYLYEEETNIIKPKSNRDIKLAPDAKFEYDILRILTDKLIICIHPESPTSAFMGTKKEGFPSFYFSKDVFYYLNFKVDDMNKIINELLNPSELIIDKEQALCLWMKIALSECLEYMEYQTNKIGIYGFSFKKASVVFSGMLKNFSVSQIYGVIKKGIIEATQNFSDFNYNNGQVRNFVANFIIDYCQDYSEDAIINNLDLKKFPRNYYKPQSIISNYFFNTVLKIGDEDFDMVPSVNSLLNNKIIP